MGGVLITIIRSIRVTFRKFKFQSREVGYDGYRFASKYRFHVQIAFM